MTHEGAIECPQDLSPQWLTEVLRRQARLASARVVNVSIARSESNTAELFSLRLEYSAGAPESAPGRLLLKVSKPQRVEEGRREVEIYRRLLPHRDALPMVVPCFDSVWSDQSQRGHVLLLDLADTHGRSAWPVPSPEHRAAITETTAHFHAYWWNHPAIPDVAPGFPWANSGYPFARCDRESFLAYCEIYRESLSRVASAARNVLTKAALRRLEWVVERLPVMWDRYLADRVPGRKDMTLCQGDSHWHQFLVPKDPRGQTYMIDLANLGTGWAANDLVYRIPYAWDRDQRRAHEMEVIEDYVRALGVHGVDYSKEAFLNDYRVQLICLYLYPVFYNTPQWHEQCRRRNFVHDHTMWFNEFELTNDAMEDLKCAELLA